MGWLWKRPPQSPSAREALLLLKKRVEEMNIPVVRDDFDAGYDMAVDEVLVLIDDALNPQSRNDDVAYGET